MNKFYRVDDGRLREEDPDAVGGLKRTRADVNAERITEGEVPPQLMPPLMHAMADEPRRMYDAYLFSAKNPEGFETVNGLLRDGRIDADEFNTAVKLGVDRPAAFKDLKDVISEGGEMVERSRLVLAVAARGYDRFVEDSLLAAMDDELGLEDVRKLTRELKAGEVGESELKGKLESLWPQPEPLEQEVREVVQPEVREPEITPEERKANQVEDSIMTTFPDEHWNRAADAYARFKDGGHSLTETEWRDVFHAVGRTHEDRFPEEKILYFENMMAQPEHISMYVNNERLSRAWKLMEGVGADIRYNPDQDFRRESFNTVFLREPEVFQFLTGEKSDSIGEAVNGVRVVCGRDNALKYLRHIISHRGQADVLADASRVTRAGMLVDSVNEEEGGLRERAFYDVFLSEPGDFQLLTGEMAGGLREAVSTVDSPVEHRLRFLEHMLSPEDPGRDYMEAVADGKSFGIAANVMDGLRHITHEFNNGRGVFKSDEALAEAMAGYGLEGRYDDMVFESVFIRSPDTFRRIASGKSHEAMREILTDNDKIRSAGHYMKDYILLLGKRPEVLGNFIEVEEGRIIWADRIPVYISAVSRLQDGDRRVKRYFHAMMGGSEYATALSNPEVIDRALGYLRDPNVMRYLQPTTAVHPDFMAMDREEQAAELNTVRRIIEEEERVEAPHREGPGVKEPRRREREAGVERERRPLRLTTTLHGVMIPNPEYASMEWEGVDSEVRSMFTLNTTHMSASEIGKLRELNLPYHQSLIFNVLTNVSGRLEASVDELQRIMMMHPLVGVVYGGEGGRDNLLADIRAMSEGNMPLYAAGGVVGIREDYTNIGRTDVGEARGSIMREAGGEDQVAVLTALAESEDHHARIDDVITKVAGFTGRHPSDISDTVRGVVGELKKQGVLVNAEPTGNEVLLSPSFIAEVQGMKVPEAYWSTYRHVVDPLARVRGMYLAEFGDEPGVEDFNPRMVSTEQGVRDAVAMFSSRDDAIITRRLALLKIMSRLNLDLNHGAKLENIRRHAGEAGLSDTMVNRVLPQLVDDREGVLQRVALGYYRINPRYWAKKETVYGEIEYGEFDRTNPEMHGNIDGERVEADVMRKVDERDVGDAMTLLKSISHQHRRRRYCARASDLRDLMRMWGVDVSLEDVTRDLDALGKSIEAPVRVRDRWVDGELVQEEVPVGASYPPLVDKYSPPEASQERYFIFNPSGHYS